MGFKDYLKIITALTKIVEKQAEAIEQMNRNHYNTERHICSLFSIMSRLEGLKEKEL
jgi:hypothetical protein